MRHYAASARNAPSCCLTASVWSPIRISAVAVDLNTLPLAALDRIEVLTDGASSTYGTDAIAGVINFITRREYQGITIGGDVQLPEEGGGEVYLANVLGGFGDLAKQGWNAFAGFNFRKQESFTGVERDFMRTSYIPSRGFNGLSPTTFPANYTQASTGGQRQSDVSELRAADVDTDSRGAAHWA